MNRLDSDYTEKRQFRGDKIEPQGDRCEQNTPCLSDKELVLLGIISEEIVHAYGIEAKIRQRRMDQWTDIGFSSIYRIVNKLEKKDLIQTSFEHKGQGATRKVHSLTALGRQALEEGVLARLEVLHNLKDPMHLALAYINVCPKQEVVERLEKRIRKIDDLQQHIDCRCHVLDKNDAVPEHIELLFENILTHIKAERSFVQEAIRKILSERGRDFFDTDIEG